MASVPVHRESEEELANPIALYRSLATAQIVDYVFSVTIILDAQKDDHPQTPTLLALWRLLGLDGSSPHSRERGCRVWRFNFGCIPAALYVKGLQHLHVLDVSHLNNDRSRPGSSILGVRAIAGHS